ncbi:MAG: hypothetical protein RLZZ387_2167 [Chloroflexota bacterium]|jgi:2'-5' RNA ligase
MPYRLFIAAELPPHVKEALVAAQSALRPGRPPVKWVAPDAMHLTLRFLGDIDEARVGPLAAALAGALAGRPAPVLQLAPAGSFPPRGLPQVLWVGLVGQVAELSQVAGAVTAAIAPLGIPPEDRPFKPHLTIGRVRRDAPRAEVAALADRLRALPPPDASLWTTEHVTLFRSELRPGGPVYTPLATVALAAG